MRRLKARNSRNFLQANANNLSQFSGQQSKHNQIDCLQSSRLVRLRGAAVKRQQLVSVSATFLSLL